MAELIEFKRGDEPVVVRIKVTGFVNWTYVYKGDGRKFKGKSDGTSEPPAHAIGTPAELENDFNSWDVLIASSGDSDAYKVDIVWKQGGSKIHDWSTSGTTTKGEATPHGGVAILVGKP